MPLEYEPSPSSGPLSQGEILAEVWEHRSLSAASSVGEEQGTEIESLLHPRVIVMTADCDLEQDFNTRFSSERPSESSDIVRHDYRHPALLPHILLCDMYEEQDIRTRLPMGSEVWRRIRQNQNERYHHLHGVSQGGREIPPDLYLDFKKAFALPTESVYMAVQADAVARMGIMPPIYIHDLMHRFYGFLSRVGLPD